MSVGLLILRLVVGALFFGHGTQKLFGWFGGHGLDGTGGFFESLRYRNGREMALVAGLAEAGGGTLLALGFLTWLGAAAILGVMLNAMIAVRIEPTSCTRPVPTRFLMPSASVMMREIRMPVFVESK